MFPNTTQHIFKQPPEQHQQFQQLTLLTYTLDSATSATMGIFWEVHYGRPGATPLSSPRASSQMHFSWSGSKKNMIKFSALRETNRFLSASKREERERKMRDMISMVGLQN
jgi:hypothetical protein